MMNADGGTAFLLDLDRADVLEDGDAIRLDSGWLVAVKAAPEKLIEVSTEYPLDLLTLAWHIGNRHVPVQVGPAWLRIAEDHVLARMFEALGASYVAIEAPFEPEAGAYAGGHHHPHHHDDESVHGGRIHEFK